MGGQRGVITVEVLVLYEWAERGALDMCGFTILGVDRGFFT